MSYRKKKKIPKFFTAVIKIFILLSSVLLISLFSYYVAAPAMRKQEAKKFNERLSLMTEEKVKSADNYVKISQKIAKQKRAEKKRQKAARDTYKLKKVDDDSILRDLLVPLDDGSTKEKLYAETLNSSVGPVTYFNQSDSRWSNYKYGKKDPMYQYGCGPTVVSMFVTALSKEYLTPDKAADLATKKGCFVQGSGSAHSIIKKCADEYNIPVKSIPLTSSSLKEALSEKKLVVALVGRGEFTKGGHFLLITKLNDDGTVSIADPISIENTHRDWDSDFIVRQLKKAVSAGPLWAVG